MNPKALLILVAVCLTTGVAIGRCGEPPPDIQTRTVKVPDTKVITKEVETVVVKPIPDSCEMIVDMIDKIVNSTGRVAATGSEIKRNMFGVTVDQLRDLRTLSEIQNDLNRQVKNLDDHLIEALELNERMSGRLQVCYDDMEKAGEE